MSVSNLVAQGAFLMVLGMSVVFVFLSILVACVTAISGWAQRANGSAAQPESPSAEGAQPAPPADLMSDPELVSVITSVIHKYRTEKGLDPKA